MELKGKSAIVTGGTRGIGRAVVDALGREGCKIAIIARTTASVTSTTAELNAAGVPAIGTAGDVSKEADVLDLFHRAGDEFGRIDILVNNAAIGNYSPIVDMTIDDWNAMLRTNLTGPFLCTREALRYMIKQGGRGEIVNVASGAATHGLAGMGAYCATKFGLRGFSESVEIEARPHDIRVSVVYPGSVDTEFAGGTGEDSGWKLRPSDVAEAILTQITASDRSWISQLHLRPRRTPST